MAIIGIKISNLPVVANATLNDFFPATQAGTTYKFSQTQLLALFSNYLAPLSGATFTGPVFVPELPLVLVPGGGLGGPEANQIVPYQNVQQQASFNGTKEAVVLASTVDIGGTYYNGPDNNGQGATLTNNGILAPLELDGFEVITGIRVLLKNQTDAITNGIYDVIESGTASVAWVLQRSSDFDNSADGQIGPGAMGIIFSGLTQLNNLWVIISPPPRIGIDRIGFLLVQASAGPSQRTGVVYLINGAASVDSIFIDNNSVVFFSVQQAIGNLGMPYLTSKTPGVGFTIGSTSINDDSLIAWKIEEAQLPVSLYGEIALIDGFATVSNSLVAAGDIIILSIKNPESSLGRIILNSINPGFGFSIESGYLIDSSIISYSIYNSSSIYQHGMATLVAGSVTVSLPTLAANDIILLTIQDGISTLGGVNIDNIVLGSSFDIVSTRLNDASVVGWVRIPAGATIPHNNEILSGGTVLVSDTNALSHSEILLTSQSSDNSSDNFSIGTIISGTSFVINSTSPIEGSTVGYIILN